MLVLSGVLFSGLAAGERVPGILNILTRLHPAKAPLLVAQKIYNRLESLHKITSVFTVFGPILHPLKGHISGCTCIFCWIHLHPFNKYIRLVILVAIVGFPKFRSKVSICCLNLIFLLVVL